MRLPLFVLLILFLELPRILLLLFRSHGLSHLFSFQINLSLNIAILDEYLLVFLKVNHDLLFDHEVICFFELNVLSR